MEINNFLYFSASSSRGFKSAPLYAVQQKPSQFIPLTTEALTITFLYTLIISEDRDSGPNGGELSLM
jgi:hypothetical protein